MDNGDALRLSEFLPFQLSVLSNTVSRRIAALYDREFGLGIGEWRVMAVLGEQAGLAASDITGRTAMDKVAVSRSVAALLERGFVERLASEGDGRRSPLRLTKAGRAVYRRIVPMARGVEEELTRSLSAADLQRLRVLLKALSQTASPDRALW